MAWWRDGNHQPKAVNSPACGKLKITFDHRCFSLPLPLPTTPLGRSPASTPNTTRTPLSSISAKISAASGYFLRHTSRGS